MKIKKKYSILILLLPLLMSAQQNNKSINQDFIPFQNSTGRWGYLDAETFAVKIQPKYDFVRLFENSVAQVSIANPNAKNYNEKNLYGLIDTTGKELFAPQFPYRYEVKTHGDSVLSNLIEYVNLKGEKGIAKTDGSWLIPLGKYDWFDFYSKKLIIADKHFIIHDGKTVELPKDYKVEWIDLENKLAHFKKSELYEGVSNLNGKVVVPPEYLEISYHPESKRFLASKPKHKLTKSNALKMLRSLVSSDDQEGTHTSLLDKKGKEIAFFKSRYYPDVNEKTGIGSFEKNGETFYFSMKTGEYLSENSGIGQKSKYYIFEENQLKGVKNSSGEIVIPANYRRLRFLDSLTLIAKNTQNYNEGLIDVNGKTVLPFQYRSLHYADFGKLTAEKEKGYGLITKKGEILTDFQFYNGIYFSDDGFATVYKANAIDTIPGKKGVVDSTGKIVVPIEYDDIFDTHIVDKTEKTYFTASKNDKWGVLDSAGKTIVPFQYGSVSINKDDFKRGWVNTQDLPREKRGAINLKTNVKIPADYNFLRLYKNFIIGSHYRDNHYTYCLLNSSGEKISDDRYSELDYKQGFLLARKNKSYGIIDIHGKILIPFEYDYIWTKTKDLVMVKKDEKYMYININGKKYLPKS